MEYESTSLKDDSLRGQARDLLAFVGVGTYLAGVGTYLRLRGKIKPALPLATICHNTILERVYGVLGQATSGPLEQITHLDRYAYSARIPVLETDMLGQSKVEIFEDGVRLGDGHDDHSEISGLGEGRYSHWGIYSCREGLGVNNFSALWFSTSDNTDPRTNGRRYTFHVT